MTGPSVNPTSAILVPLRLNDATLTPGRVDYVYQPEAYSCTLFLSADVAPRVDITSKIHGLKPCWLWKFRCLPMLLVRRAVQNIHRKEGFAKAGHLPKDVVIYAD